MPMGDVSWCHTGNNMIFNYICAFSRYRNPLFESPVQIGAYHAPYLSSLPKELFYKYTVLPEKKSYQEISLYFCEQHAAEVLSPSSQKKIYNHQLHPEYISRAQLKAVHVYSEKVGMGWDGNEWGRIKIGVDV